MYAEDDLLPISGLQHLAFCPRQCALIHIERLWEENRLTAEGRVLHERVHSDENETRNDVRIVRGLRIVSRRLGLSGIADVVEFHRLSDDRLTPNHVPRQESSATESDARSGCRLPDISGTWLPYPVEYKRGRPKKDDSDTVQLCAQAICLEEAFGVTIDRGMLFYGQTRRRVSVAFDQNLRARTTEMAMKFHKLVEEARIPAAKYSRACKNCSLLADCQPNSRKSAANYLARMLADLCDDNPRDD